MNSDFEKDVLEGLSVSPKQIPSKYFYDKRGSELFVEIMKTDEYYVTNAEMDIFKHKSASLLDGLSLDQNKKYEIIELGAGDGSKTVHLLKEMLDQNYTFDYIPIDISIDALKGLEKRLSLELSQLSINIQEGEYFSILNRLKENKKAKVILFLGSNLGNLTDDQSADFIHALGEALNKNDKILLGLDLIKSRQIVLPAYNDKGGVTANFNLNLLTRMNRELGADFNIDNFFHRPEYSEEEGIARSYLVSKISQDVYIEKLDKRFHFKKDERMQTEMSRKYNLDIINKILSKTDFQISYTIYDNKKLFANYIITRL